MSAICVDKISDDHDQYKFIMLPVTWRESARSLYMYSAICSRNNLCLDAWVFFLRTISSLWSWKWKQNPSLSWFCAFYYYDFHAIVRRLRSLSISFSVCFLWGARQRCWWFDDGCLELYETLIKNYYINMTLLRHHLRVHWDRRQISVHTILSASLNVDTLRPCVALLEHDKQFE